MQDGMRIFAPDESLDVSGYGGRTLNINRKRLLQSMWAEYARMIAAPIVVWPMDAPPLEGVEDDDGVEYKVCRQCGEVFYRAEGRTNSVWARQKYCSTACSRKAQFYVPVPKKCAVCGAEFTRRSNEEHNNYKDRQTCCTKCSLVLRTRTIANWRKKTIGVKP